ncbi:MAG: PIG-L family deacetylase [Marinirhabdus sp.]
MATLKYAITAFLLVGNSLLSQAQQPKKPTTSQIYHNLQDLNFLGSALYIAAHPDDENTRLISFLANGLHARTAYLSLTRGDGGQNLVGPELRELLGVIRTQELVAARNIDGGQQLFTRANDFGYSKHPDETLAIWNKTEVLGDVVRAVRKFRPDVIINRFDHRSPGSTHGHHTASAMLSVQAFDLVNDPSKYPATAAQFGTWQPKRLFFNTSWWFYGSRENFEKADKSKLVQVETGGYYPALGLSNGEIAALSRSMHKSQGFGSTGSRGSQTEHLEFLKGSFPNKKTVFDGINTTWSRVAGGKEIGAILNTVEKNFNFKDPAAMVPQLLQAYRLVKNLKDPFWRDIKLKQLQQLLLDCAGVYLEAVSTTNTINPKSPVNVNFELINRSSAPFSLKEIKTPAGITIEGATALKKNEKVQFSRTLQTQSTTTSAPYWLETPGSLGMYTAPENLIGLPGTPAPQQVIFVLAANGTTLEVTRNIVYKTNDAVKGEVYRPLAVMPKVTSRIPEKVIIFSSEKPKQVPVVISSAAPQANGSVKLNHPKGWNVTPAQHVFNLKNPGETVTVYFTVTPPKKQSEGPLQPLVAMGGALYNKELVTIDYGHIPFQQVLLPSQAKVVRIPLEKKGEHIGYINGAGDAIPESLRSIGYKVTQIEPGTITAAALEKYAAVVVGIRAYNTVPQLAFKQNELNTYVENGGTLLLQYNTAHRLVTKDIAPYPITLSRDRVTDEFSDVTVLAPDHPVLNFPNKITQTDFEGWVQERGLYFPNKWDSAFTPILGMHDKDQPETQGALLVAQHGKGHYIYTGLSFFRELPAGVAGAYRLFANILSLGK